MAMFHQLSTYAKGVECSGMVDSVVAVTVLAVFAGLFLMFRRESGPAVWRRDRADSIAKYVIATFLGTYGSVAAATLLVLPILLYGRLAHSQTAEEIFSAAVDRPYFPLQSVVAFAVGFAVAVRLRLGKPMWVWVWPVAQVVISIALHKPRSVLQGFTANVWQTYFNWDCGCSATLLQWHVMSAVYAAIAFTLGALVRNGLTERRQDTPSSQIESVR
jgi:hypothetical protein